MGCSDAFHDFISNCNTTLRVNALLLPATTYTWVITDKFQKEYSGTALTNGDGFMDIAIADLPEGFFTEFSGAFHLEIFETDTCKKASFKMARYYDAIDFDVKGGTRVKDSLGCDFACDAEGGDGNSAVFPFTDAATVSIPWTALLKSLYGNTPDVSVYHEIAPDTYQLVNVSVVYVGGVYDPSEIQIDNGGAAAGYILVS